MTRHPREKQLSVRLRRVGRGNRRLRALDRRPNPLHPLAAGACGSTRVASRRVGRRISGFARCVREHPEQLLRREPRSLICESNEDLIGLVEIGEIDRNRSDFVLDRHLRKNVALDTDEPKHTVRGRELVLSASDVHLAPRRPLQVEHSNRVTWLYSSRTPRRSKPRRSRWLQGG